MQSNAEKLAIMQANRDKKVHEHLSQYAPVWLVNEQAQYDTDALQFEVIFNHPRYGWVNRRYNFDSYNDVLYHKGQTLVSEEDTFELQNQDPYIPVDFANTVNSYGG
ncbi:MAG TPA: hypothetical protein VJZ27_12340 [Aggregatilineales bacterium]|nr:hypothetical protein [Aggregatilineales bacterium]